MKIELDLIKDAIDDFILLDKVCATGPSPGLLALKQTLDGDVETLIDKYDKSKNINQENQKTDTFDDLNFNNMLNDSNNAVGLALSRPAISGAEP